MSWSVNASGHVETPETENKLIESLSGTLREFGGSGTFSGQFSGPISLPVPQGEGL